MLLIRKNLMLPEHHRTLAVGLAEQSSPCRRAAVPGFSSTRGFPVAGKKPTPVHRLDLNSWALRQFVVQFTSISETAQTCSSPGNNDVTWLKPFSHLALALTSPSPSHFRPDRMWS